MHSVVLSTKSPLACGLESRNCTVLNWESQSRLHSSTLRDNKRTWKSGAEHVRPAMCSACRVFTLSELQNLTSTESPVDSIGNFSDVLAAGFVTGS